MARSSIHWQSKTVLLLTLPIVCADVFLESTWWFGADRAVAIWALGLSALLGLAAFQARSATADAAFSGAVITASLMFGSAHVPYVPWRTLLVPVLLLLILTSIATRLGRHRKQQLGTAEARKGRVAAQVAANLGIAALAANPLTQGWLSAAALYRPASLLPAAAFAPALAALVESAADTLSSELGQLLQSRPRMITTLRVMPPGTDGAISLGGTLAGALGGALVGLAGTWALDGGSFVFWISFGGGLFGLFFDSLLGATLERRGWLNNDAVNFVSTISAALVATAALALAPFVVRF